VRLLRQGNGSDEVMSRRKRKDKIYKNSNYIRSSKIKYKKEDDRHKRIFKDPIIWVNVSTKKLFLCVFLFFFFFC
jgi:hypothetical protein